LLAEIPNFIDLGWILPLRWLITMLRRIFNSGGLVSRSTTYSFVVST